MKNKADKNKTNPFPAESGFRILGIGKQEAIKYFFGGNAEGGDTDTNKTVVDTNSTDGADVDTSETPEDTTTMSEDSTDMSVDSTEENND